MIVGSGASAMRRTERQVACLVLLGGFAAGIAAQTPGGAAGLYTREDLLFLRHMIVHHEGALAMGRAQQRRQFESGRQPYGIDVLVDEILVVQRAEITRMKSWLTQWGLSSSGGRSRVRGER